MTDHKYASFAEANLNIVQKNGSEWMVRCLFHENEGSPAMQFNVDKGMFVCFSCGAGGGMKKLSAKLGIVHREPEHDVNDLIGRLNQLRKQSDREPHLTVLPEDHLTRYQFPTDYWTGRGFTEETIHAFQLGFDPMEEAAIIPVRNLHGGLIGTIRRFLDIGPDDLKYKYPFGFKRAHHLFGSWLVEHEPDDIAVLVEGTPDAMAVWQAGYMGLACYGDTISLEQIRILRRLGIREVIACPDNDTAGRKFLQRMQGMKTHLRDDKRVDEYVKELDLSREFQFRVVDWSVLGRRVKDPGALAAHPADLRKLLARSKRLL